MPKPKKKEPTKSCKQKKCFANESGGCRILFDTDFGERECPFYKTDSSMTNGVRYPFNPNYAGKQKLDDLPERTETEWAKEWDRLTARYRKKAVNG